MATGGLKAVAAALDAARPAPDVGNPGPEERGPDLPRLKPGCPVRPLGKSGQTCFYLDEAGQLIPLGPRDHGKLHIQNMFGRQANLVHEYWPRFGKVDPTTGEPKVTGWMPEKAAEDLMGACADVGMFDPSGKERGRGAWRGSKDELVLHCGDKVYRSGMPVGQGWTHPGVLDGFVYSTAPAMPRPDPGPVDDTVGIMLLKLLGSWYWERQKVDPYLLLGYIAQAPFGGALEWRSHVWVSGDSATGKSTLEKKILAPLFEGCSLRTHQATEAAIRQVLGKQTLPVFFDELEAEENNDRAQKVIGLARLASSEGVIFRGGSDHRASEFIARSCFYFSSILLPPMLAQDRNRMAILELKRIPDRAAVPMIDRDVMLELGRKIRRRVVDQWHRLEETLAAYKKALGAAGHRGRSADQFGGLLAFADLLLYDGVPEAELLGDWAQALHADTLAETADNLTDSEEGCQFLAGTLLQLRGGDEPEPISRFLERATGRQAGGLDTHGDVDRARRTLENHGLRIVAAVEPKAAGKGWGCRDPQVGDTLYVAIANSHEALARLFRDKRWAKGVWSQTFGRVDGAIKRVQCRFAGTSRKATLVPLAALLDEDKGE